MARNYGPLQQLGSALGLTAKPSQSEQQRDLTQFSAKQKGNTVEFSTTFLRDGKEETLTISIDHSPPPKMTMRTSTLPDRETTVDLTTNTAVTKAETGSKWAASTAKRSGLPSNGA